MTRYSLLLVGLTSLVGCEASPTSDPYFEVALVELALPHTGDSGPLVVETFGDAARLEIVREYGFPADSASIDIPSCTADFSCRFNWEKLQIDTILRPRDDGDWAVSFSRSVYFGGLNPDSAPMGTGSAMVGELVLRYRDGIWESVGTTNLIAVH